MQVASKYHNLFDLAILCLYHIASLSSPASAGLPYWETIMMACSETKCVLRHSANRPVWLGSEVRSNRVRFGKTGLHNLGCLFPDPESIATISSGISTGLKDSRRIRCPKCSTAQRVSTLRCNHGITCQACLIPSSAALSCSSKYRQRHDLIHFLLVIFKWILLVNSAAVLHHSYRQKQICHQSDVQQLRINPCQCLLAWRIIWCVVPVQMSALLRCLHF